MGIQADIMQTALDKYLGSEDQWCTRSLAKNKLGRTVDYTAPNAVSHCGEGAILAATWFVTHFSTHSNELHKQARLVLVGVEKVLMEQHPDITNDAVELWPELMNNTGRSIPVFNDGISGDGEFSVGYREIRKAFEKYLAECEEKGL